MEKLIYYDRYAVNQAGCVFNAITGKQLKPGKNSRGYMTVSLYDGSSPKKAKSFLVHRLIAEAFFGKNDLQINHKNGDKTDNRLENLEFVTAQENVDHARNVLGKTQHGESNSRCKIPAAVVQAIKRNDRTAQSWADELKCNANYIWQIRAGTYRSHG